jgi:hypothetical protein
MLIAHTYLGMGPTTGNDARGDIVGQYLDAANVSHGYLLRDGQFATVDFPGATFSGLTAMNKNGDIVGRSPR